MSAALPPPRQPETRPPRTGEGHVMIDLHGTLAIQLRDIERQAGVRGTL
jgi:hypothetical protein